MSADDRVYVGMNTAVLETGEPVTKVSRVILNVDANNYFTAGDDTGRVLEVECPWGSQAMANAILATMQSVDYLPFNGQSTIIDPACEIGDGITIGGVYSILADMDLKADRACWATVSAPDDDEIDDEYPYQSHDQRMLNRQLAQTKSLITKSAEEITLSVESLVTSEVARIDIQLDSITSTVQGLEGDISQINQTVNSISLSVSNGSTSSQITLTAGGITLSSQTISMSGLVTYTGLSSGTTTIDGGCIQTGTISAARLELTGAITWADLSSSVQSEINTAESTASSALSTATSASSTANSVQSTVSGWTYSGTTYIDGTKLQTGTVTASTLRGGEIDLLDSSGTYCGMFTLTSSSTASYAVDLTSGGAIRINSTGSGAIYLNQGGNSAFSLQGGLIRPGNTMAPSNDGVQYLGNGSYRWAGLYAVTDTILTSDSKLKEEIEDLPEKYVDLLMLLEPRRFKFTDGTSDRYHVGYVAQEIEPLMEQCGIDSQEFGGFVIAEDEETGEKRYYLRYGEFGAIYCKAIQELNARIKKLEEMIA